MGTFNMLELLTYVIPAHCIICTSYHKTSTCKTPSYMAIDRLYIFPDWERANAQTKLRLNVATDVTEGVTVGSSYISCHVVNAELF